MKFFLYGNDSLSDMGNLQWFYNVNFVLPLILRAFHDDLQEHQRNLESEYHFVFQKLIEQLNKLSPQDQKTYAVHLNLLIYNLLSLRIFTEPQDKHQAMLPVFNKHLGVWEFKVCQFQRGLITNHERLQSILKEEDHVPFYVIVPQDEKHPEHYPVIVVFMGTTFPAGQGIGMQDMTNSMPDYEIGQYLIEADIFGKNEVFQSLDRPEYQNREIVLTGASLGGMLAQMYGMYLSPKLKSQISVYAFNPATFFELPTESHPYFGEFFRMNPDVRAQLTVLSQQGDPVSGAGLFLECVNLYRTKFPLPLDKSKLAEYEMKHPSMDKLLEISGQFSWFNLLKPGFGKRFMLFAYVSHLVIQLTHPGVQLEKVESVAEVNKDPVRVKATEIGKTKLRPFLYEQAKKATPHLSDLPDLNPLHALQEEKAHQPSR